MKTDSEISAERMAALVAALGAVDAHRFIPSLSRERVDYTERRRTHVPQMSVTEMSDGASQGDQPRVVRGVRRACPKA